MRAAQRHDQGGLGEPIAGQRGGGSHTEARPDGHEVRDIAMIDRFRPVYRDPKRQRSMLPESSDAVTLGQAPSTQSAEVIVARCLLINSAQMIGRLRKSSGGTMTTSRPSCIGRHTNAIIPMS